MSPTERIERTQPNSAPFLTVAAARECMARYDIFSTSMHGSVIDLATDYDKHGHAYYKLAFE